MRVVAGKFKRTVLCTLEGDATRPTKDMVKEALFSSLNDIDGQCFLDLFSGSGSIGIEAISRGANKVVFNDASKDACKVIKQNLNKLKLDSTLLNLDYLECLKRLHGQKFDYIFCDPPYAFDGHLALFNAVIANDLLNDGGMLIFEVRKGTQIEYPTTVFELLKSKNYGISQLNYFVKVQHD